MAAISNQENKRPSDPRSSWSSFMCFLPRNRRARTKTSARHRRISCGLKQSVKRAIKVISGKVT